MAKPTIKELQATIRALRADAKGMRGMIKTREALIVAVGKEKKVLILTFWC